MNISPCNNNSIEPWLGIENANIYQIAAAVSLEIFLSRYCSTRTASFQHVCWQVVDDGAQCYRSVTLATFHLFHFYPCWVQLTEKKLIVRSSSDRPVSRCDTHWECNSVCREIMQDIFYDSRGPPYLIRKPQNHTSYKLYRDIP